MVVTPEMKKASCDGRVVDVGLGRAAGALIVLKCLPAKARFDARTQFVQP